MAKAVPDEQYTPRGAKIPIPKRDDFVDNMRKVIAAEPPPKRSGRRVTKPPRNNPEAGSK